MLFQCNPNLITTACTFALSLFTCPNSCSSFVQTSPLPNPRMTEGTEPPFVSRERIKKHQQYFQSVRKPTYLKGRYDMITSVAIPLALATSSLVLTTRGIYNMAHGIGKKA